MSQARAQIEAAFRAAVARCEPGAAVRSVVERQGERLRVGERCFDLERFSGVTALGAGKAAGPMARAIEELLGERLRPGVAVTKAGHGVALDRVELLVGSHPSPDAASEAAGRRLLAEARRLGPGDLLLFLLSGGASALAEVPAEGLTLDDLRRTSDALLGSGAPIEDINAVRKHLSSLKGGRLAEAAGSARVVTLALSDVAGAPLDAVGSGPTLPDPTTWADVARVVAAYRVALPPAVRSLIDRGTSGLAADTPKRPRPGDLALEVGSCRLAAEAAAEALRALGLRVQVAPSPLRGEARELGRALAEQARSALAAGASGEAWVLAGEAAVTVRGPGLGGRNQELALAASLGLAGLAGATLGALATDGQDGPTDAAGAVVDGRTAQAIAAAGLDARAQLDRNDAYPALDAAGALVRTGPTRTNVNDLVLLLLEAAAPGPALRLILVTPRPPEADRWASGSG